jgi:hypothetical protein
MAVLGGPVGAPRFFLHGFGDLWGWLLVLCTLLGAQGAWRMRTLGIDDRLGWLLAPLLGLAISVSMLHAIVLGLTPDEQWNARYPSPQGFVRTGWGPILGVITAVFIGATALMATLAFGIQHLFEAWGPAA